MATNEELQRQIDDLRNLVNKFFNSAEVPLELDQALRERFKLDTVPILILSGKGNTSENQTVNEAGAAPVYGVLRPPDHFFEFSQDGTTYYIPIYT